ncbi:MAG: hypothetical protein NPINA01_21800 [Nitrospinaceae bacterium]|nr:MAG: hypothetical protein NPINA01_21800 [Nitrospinaceae bacterium]
MSTKEAYLQKFRAQLDEWDAEIQKLKARAQKASAELKIDYKEDLEEMRAKQEVARKKLDELTHSGDEAWEDLKDGMEKAWNDLGAAVKSAISRFK